MTATAGPLRRVRIEALSARSELSNVLRGGMAITVGVWMYVAVDSSTFQGSKTERRNLLPFQLLVQNRPLGEQRVFLELQEGLLEAEARRAVAGVWPAVPSLATDGIPPFAPDPTAKGSPYEWRLIQSGTLVNYLGLPERPGNPAWLVLVQEPEPGGPPDPAREDEEHHRLVTGTMLHVSTWVQPDGGRLAHRIVRLPQAEGWVQLYAVGPSVPSAGR
jgi:hypothetical protein